MRVLKHILLCGCLWLLTGCDQRAQSILDPRSTEAGTISDLWWVMMILGSVVFVIVMFFTMVAVLGKSGARPPGGSVRFIWAGGIIIPAVILVGLLIYSLKASFALSPSEEGITIEVDGVQWWWEVRYPEYGIITANEIHIPAGEHVRFKLTARDVIHSFWIPNLHGKLDMMPGHTTTISIRAGEPGVWRGQCAEFCGTQHAWMAFEVIAHEPEDFQRWLEERKQAMAAARNTIGSDGEKLFFQHGCHSCHAISGTEAISNIGPDLTHLGDRRMLGAAVIPNDRGNLAGWISDPQSMKPGNLMPATYMPPEDLHALVDHLLSIDGKP